MTLGLHDSQSSPQKKRLTKRMNIIKLKLEGSDKHVFVSTFPPQVPFLFLIKSFLVVTFTHGGTMKFGGFIRGGGRVYCLKSKIHFHHFLSYIISLNFNFPMNKIGVIILCLSHIIK